MKEEKELFELEVEGNEGGEETPNPEEMEMEMELEVDADELEEVVAKNVEKQEQNKKKTEKGKRGPKGPRNNKGGEKTASKKKDVDLSDIRILEREIKKGTVAAPQGRIEKLVDGENTGKYRMLLAEGGVMTKADVKEYEEVGIVEKMNDGKWILTNIAVERFGKKFKHQNDDGQEVNHDIVRIELHKPGREKDVTEIFRTGWAIQKAEEAKIKSKQKQEVEEKVKTEKAEETVQQEAAQ